MKLYRIFAFKAAAEELLSHDSLNAIRARDIRYDNEVPANIQAIYPRSEYESDVEILKESIVKNDMDATWDKVDIFSPANKNICNQLESKKFRLILALYSQGGPKKKPLLGQQLDAINSNLNNCLTVMDEIVQDPSEVYELSIQARNDFKKKRATAPLTP